MCACVDPTVVSEPGWKSMCTSTIGNASASTQAPGDARGNATPRSPRKDVRTATGGHYSGRPDADAPPVAALGHGDRPLRKRRPRVPRQASWPRVSWAPTRTGSSRSPIVAAGFLQVLLDLTVEEAMIKYGFRYTTAEQLGTAAAAVPPGDGAEDARRRARRRRPRAPRAVRGLGVQRGRARGPVPARSAAPGHVHPRGAGRRGARAHRPVRRPRRVHVPHAAAARDRPRRRRALRRHRGGARARARPDRRLARGRPGGDRASSAVPRARRRSRSARTGRRSSASWSGRASARGSSRCARRSCRSCSAWSPIPKQVGYFRVGQAPQTGLTAVTAPGAPDPDHRADPRLGGGGRGAVFAGLRRYSTRRARR